FQEIMRLCVRMIAELMESRAVVFMLLDDEEKELVIQSALGLPPAHAESYRAPKRQGLLGEVILTGEPKLGCAEEDDGPLAVVVTPAVAGPTQASAPLVIGRRVVGVVAVANKVDLTPFAADDLNLLVTLCERVSAALAGALKYSGDANRLAKIVEALEALVKMKHSSIPTVNPLALRLLGRTAGLLGLSLSEVKRLQYLVALHDAGMVRVDEEIIHKRGELTEDERDEVDSHVEKGADLMAPLLLRPEMEEIILSHHERVDGTGYPAGRQGGEIPLGSRILAVLDAFFAMIQSRPYRKKLPAAEVVKEIRTHAGTQFDSAVVDGFLQVLCEEGIVTADTENSDIFMGLTPTTPDEEEQTWQPLGS
ncbi:MAG: GAF domain-containing protein, partial [Acidobacteria bacterium]|nr:GAF domain-containing protein [Acidobacteriota bacterium]